MSFFEDGFEWDSGKAITNLRKHCVSFHEARGVFFDGRAIDLFDREVDGEDRYATIGLSAKGRLITTCWCERGFLSKTIRIISARKATTKEVNAYNANEV